MVESIRQYFSRLSDPRHRRGRRHRVDELVIIAILAVICSADNWQEVAQWARAKHKWLKTFLELPHSSLSYMTPAGFAELRREAGCIRSHTPVFDGVQDCGILSQTLDQKRGQINTTVPQTLFNSIFPL